MDVKQKILSKQLRFKDEFGNNYPDWEEKKLGKELEHKSIRNKSNQVDLVLSVSNKKGFISQQEQFDGHQVASKDVTNYKVVNKGDYAYNPSRINVGSIARLDDFEKGIVSPMYVIFRLKNNLNPIFFDALLSSHRFKYLIKIGCSGSVRDSLNFDEMEKFEIKLPFIEEQKKIANFLSSVDKKLQQLTKKKELLETYKKGVMQKIFSQELRFKDEFGNNYPDWEEKKIEEIVREIKNKTTVSNQYPILSSSKRGLQLQEDYFTKQTASINNTGYKILIKGDFTYRSMSDTGSFTFNQQNIIDIGIVSPAYPVFRCKKSIMDTFLHFYLNNNLIVKRQILTLKEGGTRYAMGFSRFKNLRIELPSLDEQQKIANFLSSIDKKIELVSTQIENTKVFKKGLLQQMFV